MNGSNNALGNLFVLLALLSFITLGLICVLRQEVVFIETEIYNKFEEETNFYFVIKYDETNETIRVEEEIWNSYDVGSIFIYKKALWKIGW